MVSYRDYEWTENDRYLYTFCLTFIRHASIEDVIEGLPISSELGEHDLPTLVEMSSDSWERVGDDRLLVGLFELGTWTVAYESNGYVGVLSELMKPLSRGREIVAYMDGDTGAFYRYVDGATRTWFTPLFASRREGSTPDELLEIMNSVGGFRLLPEDEAVAEFHHKPATFALAHAVTGIELTRARLTNAVFRVVEVVIRPEREGVPQSAVAASAAVREIDQIDAIRGWAESLGYSTKPVVGKSDKDRAE